jgi:predicted PilT family ATPase
MGKIAFGGKEYEAILTTEALFEIIRKYGSVEEMENVLSKASGMQADALDLAVSLAALMINGGLKRWNFENPQDKKALVTEEEILIFTSPMELAGLFAATMAEFTEGMGRSVKTEEQPKNI